MTGMDLVQVADMLKVTPDKIFEIYTKGQCIGGFVGILFVELWGAGALLLVWRLARISEKDEEFEEKIGVYGLTAALILIVWTIFLCCAYHFALQLLCPEYMTIREILRCLP